MSAEESDEESVPLPLPLPCLNEEVLRVDTINDSISNPSSTSNFRIILHTPLQLYRFNDLKENDSILLIREVLEVEHPYALKNRVISFDPTGVLIVNEDLSFKECGIQDGDIIYAVINEENEYSSDDNTSHKTNSTVIYDSTNFSDHNETCNDQTTDKRKHGSIFSDSSDITHQKKKKSENLLSGNDVHTTSCSNSIAICLGLNSNEEDNQITKQDNHQMKLKGKHPINSNRSNIPTSSNTESMMLIDTGVTISSNRLLKDDNSINELDLSNVTKGSEENYVDSTSSDHDNNEMDSDYVNNGKIDKTTTSTSNKMQTRGIQTSYNLDTSSFFDGYVDDNGRLEDIGIEEQFFNKMQGLFSLCDMNKETFLGRYKGEIFRKWEQVCHRLRHEGGRYVAEVIPERKWVCGKRFGNILKYMNHHCTKYNCQLRRFKERNGTWSVGIWTIKKIKKGDSLFFCYSPITDNIQSKSIGEPILCLCKGLSEDNTPICTKIL